MKNNVIAFSGGCYSGKTTTIEFIKENYTQKEVLIASENIRDFIDKEKKDIDSIRENPSDYLKLQNKIIRLKIESETKLIVSNTNKLILLDRSLNDSLFYLLFYVDKSKLNSLDFELYKNLINFLSAKNNYFNQVFYTNVLEFKPILSECEDKVYRPNKIEYLKEIEGVIISQLNESYGNKVIKIDLNKMSVENILNIIK
jgi:hypothetical protein